MQFNRWTDSDTNTHKQDLIAASIVTIKKTRNSHYHHHHQQQQQQQQQDIQSHKHVMTTFRHSNLHDMTNSIAEVPEVGV